MSNNLIIKEYTACAGIPEFTAIGNGLIRLNINRGDVFLENYEPCEDVNVHIIEMKRRMNTKNFRIRFLKQSDNERTEIVVLTLIRTNLNLIVNASDFVFCKRVETYDGSLPMDILVEFKDVVLREKVFSMREVFRHLGIEFWDNLCPERINIWKEAVRKFGINKVCIRAGTIQIQTDDSSAYRILTQYQFRKLLEQYNL